MPLEPQRRAPLTRHMNCLYAWCIAPTAYLGAKLAVKSVINCPYWPEFAWGIWRISHGPKRCIYSAFSKNCECQTIPVCFFGIGLCLDVHIAGRQGGLLAWGAQICVDGKPVSLGLFATVEKAAQEYDAHARRLGKPGNGVKNANPRGARRIIRRGSLSRGEILKTTIIGGDFYEIAFEFGKENKGKHGKS